MHENEAKEKGKEVSPSKKTKTKLKRKRRGSQVSLVSVEAVAETIGVHCTKTTQRKRKCGQVL